MPSNACFTALGSVGVPRLRRVLRGLAWLYPDVGYCQGTGMVRACTHARTYTDLRTHTTTSNLHMHTYAHAHTYSHNYANTHHYVRIHIHKLKHTPMYTNRLGE
jgi:hypothetical protein